MSTHPTQHSSRDRWGVSENGIYVLVQLDDGETQIRVALTPTEAAIMERELQEARKSLIPPPLPWDEEDDSA